MENNIKNAQDRFKKADKKVRTEQHVKRGDLYYGYMSGKDFSLFMQDLLISDGGYVLDTGNYENVNYVCAYELLMKVKKHPLLWKLFFMVI